MNLTKLLSADKDRSVFFTSVTVLGSAAAVIAVGNEQYTVTAVAAGAAAVGVVGLLSRALIELATPIIRTAVQSMTGRFRKFEDTTYNHIYHH